MKPNILIIGESGSGKSTSLRNLPPEQTFIFNLNRNVLPFKNASKYKQYIPKDYSAVTYKEFMFAFNEMFNKNNPKAAPYKYVVIDEFTSMCEIILAQGEATRSGFDIWKFYNDEIKKCLEISKSDPNKYVIFTGHPEWNKDEERQKLHKSVFVKGKEWRGKVEKEFLIVLFTELKVDQNGKTTHEFVTNNYYTAKSPMDMLPENIDNDIMEVIKLSEEYYNPTIKEERTDNA